MRSAPAPTFILIRSTSAMTGTERCCQWTNHDPQRYFGLPESGHALARKGTLKFAVRGNGRHRRVRSVVNSPLVYAALFHWR